MRKNLLANYQEIYLKRQYWIGSTRVEASEPRRMTGKALSERVVGKRGLKI